MQKKSNQNPNAKNNRTRMQQYCKLKSNILVRRISNPWPGRNLISIAAMTTNSEAKTDRNYQAQRLRECFDVH